MEYDFSKKKNRLELATAHYNAANTPADKLTELFASLLIEALYRRIAKLTAKKIIPVADWAKNNNINLQSATNKAIRGTIPAFRVRGHWMIDRDYTE